MGFSASFMAFAVGVSLFFIGFNMFEPLLQSFVSKFAKIHQKGTALGVANTFAYVGIFLGGAIGGMLYGHFSERGVAIFVIIIALFWIVWVSMMRNPSLRKNLYLNMDKYAREKLTHLSEVEGIVEYYINESEHILIIKYDTTIISDASTIEAMLSK
jgi:MFS family permease